MVSPYWPDHAKQLKRHGDRLDVGVHLTLTDQEPLGSLPKTAPGKTFPAFKNLLRQSVMGTLNLTEIEQEIGRQLDAFVSHFGRAPDFIDGHQHVQQLPGIRDLIVKACLEKFCGAMPYMRECSAPMNVLLRRRKATVRALGIGLFGRSLRELAQRNNIAVNKGFSGVYNFSPAVPYNELFKRFLIGVTDRSLIMCHPGIVDKELEKRDTLTHQREIELKYFLGDEFSAALVEAGVRLCRFQDC